MYCFEILLKLFSYRIWVIPPNSITFNLYTLRYRKKTFLKIWRRWATAVDSDVSIFRRAFRVISVSEGGSRLICRTACCSRGGGTSPFWGIASFEASWKATWAAGDASWAERAVLSRNSPGMWTRIRFSLTFWCRMSKILDIFTVWNYSCHIVTSLYILILYLLN